jgi:hypothetical protein
MSDHIHWITRNPRGDGNVTACGKQFVFPLRGNGWRVRDITCPECDNAICDYLHQTRSEWANGDAPKGDS